MRLFKTWEETKKLPQNGRLAWYTGSADVEHSTNITKKDVDAASLLHRARQGRYVQQDLFHKFLPRDKPVLDGGCNVGGVVLGLRTEGYDAIGVDLSPGIVDMARRIASDLDIQVGDILDIPFPDGYFEGYVSLGIVEHFL